MILASARTKGHCIFGRLVSLIINTRSVLVVTQYKQSTMLATCSTCSLLFIFNKVLERRFNPFLVYCTYFFYLPVVGVHELFCKLLVATSFSVSSTLFPYLVFIVLTCRGHKKDKYTLVSKSLACGSFLLLSCLWWNLLVWLTG